MHFAAVEPASLEVADDVESPVAFVQLPVLAVACQLAWVDLDQRNRQVTDSHVDALPELELGQQPSVVAEHVRVVVVAVASWADRFEQD